MIYQFLKRLVSFVDTFIERRSWIVVPCVLAIILISLYGQLEVQSTIGSDFSQDYYAGSAVLRGSSIYGDGLQGVIVEHNHLQGYALNQIENFHPPFVAVIFSSLAKLHYRTAFLTFSFMSILSFLVLAYYSMKGCSISAPTKMVISSFLLYWNPIFVCLILGQLSCFIALGLIAVFELCRSQRSNLAGVMLGIVSHLKLFPLFLIFYFWRRSDYVAIIATIITFSVITIFTGSYLGYDVIFEYIVNVAPRDVTEWATYPTVVSMTSFFYPIFIKSTFFEVWYDNQYLAKFCVLVFSVLISFLCISKKDYKDDSHRFYTFIVSMTLLSPIMWTHFFMVLLPLFITVMNDRSFSRKSRAGIGICFLVTFLKDIQISRMARIYFEPEKVSLLALPVVKTGLIVLITLFIILIQKKSAPDFRHQNRV